METQQDQISIDDYMELDLAHKPLPTPVKQTVPPAPAFTQDKTVRWQCKMCGNEYELSITDDQHEILSSLGLSKMRPNICGECRTEPDDIRMLPGEINEANFYASTETKTYRRWENKLRYRIKEYLAGFNGKPASVNDEMVALRCAKMLEYARKSRTQTDEQPEKQQGKTHDNPIRKRADIDD